MKIMHLLASDRFSGAENVVCQIIEMFKDDDELEMFYCSPAGEIETALEEREIRFVPIKKLTPVYFKKILRTYKPDIVHAHDVRASLVAAIACKKTKIISHIHVNNMKKSKHSIKTMLYSIAADKAQHIFWVSQSAFDDYDMKDRIAHKSTVLKNVINIDAVQRKCDTDKNDYSYDVAYVGRLSAQKNPKRLMYIAREIVDRNPEVNIAIVGTGDLENTTKDLCKSLNLQNNVKFIGFMSNPNKLLRSAKVMIMTSLFEGTPMVALEAMALGVPIVSTPVDGMCDLIENGVNGYLSDDNGEFADYVVDICSKNELQKKMSDNTLKKARMINDTEKYRKVIREVYHKSDS